VLRPIVFIAVLSACSSQDNTTLFAGNGPASGAGNAGVTVPTAPAAGYIASIAPRAGAPTFVWASPTAPSAQPGRVQGLSAEARARQHLQSFAAYYRFQPREVAALELNDLHDTGRGAIIARFGRRVEGIDVFGEQIAVAMNRNLDPIALSGYVSGDVPAAPRTPALPLAQRFTLTPERAVILAFAAFTGVVLDAGDLDGATPASGSYQQIGLRPGALAKLSAPPGTNPARAKATLFPAAGKVLQPAYYVEANAGGDAKGAPRYFALIISASDGKVLWKRDLTSYEAYRYRVYADADGLLTPWDGPQGTSPTPKPGGALDAAYDVPFVPPNLVSVSSLEMIGVNDPWLPAAARETIGNNVDAYLDLTPPDGFTLGTDFRGQASSPGEFDTASDPALDAASSTDQQTAGVTQVFYDVNWFHDWYYAAGFTETAGNAQASNYGRGGIEGDRVHAEAQDEGGFNNANMSTPADGESPVMQMYLWTYSPSSLTVSEPAAVAGTYVTGSADLAPSDFELSAPIVRANPPDGCTPLVGDYTGAIVLIDAGGEACGSAIPASTKALNAQQAGAVGAILANVATSVNPTIAATIGEEAPTQVTIGVATINLADGDRLRAALDAGEGLRGSLVRHSILRDGDVDNQVVAHEWGHYLNSRLVGNATGLDTNMAGGLDEGWADFNALLLSVRPEDANAPGNDDWNGVYSVVGYSAGDFTADPYYFGIRRYPYSTDSSKDPLTFQHISDQGVLPAEIPRAFDGDNAEVHNTGEVWATMLWECYAALLRDTLGPTPRLTFAEARDRMRDYLVASLKLTPNSPTLLEARDALLATALVNDPTDFALFGQAFAKRGAGVLALAPDRFDASNAGVVESYAVGAALLATAARLADDVAPVCNEDGTLDEGETGTLRVTFQNTGNAPTEALSARVSTATLGITFPDGPVIDIPALPIFGSAEGSVRVTALGLGGIAALDFSVQAPDAGTGAPQPSAYSFLANAEEVPNQSFTDNAESSHIVWSIVPSSLAVPEGSRWQRVATTVLDHFYRCSSAPLAATVDFQSPPLNVLPGEALTLSFRHRYSFEAGDTDYYDGGVIELSSDDGATWSDVGEALTGYNATISSDWDSPIADRRAFGGQSEGYPAYSTLALDLGTEFGGKTVLVRFRVGSDSGVTSQGWDLDDISVSGIAGPPLFDTVVPQPVTCDDTPAPVFVAP
jgi:large repetitive protein